MYLYKCNNQVYAEQFSRFTACLRLVKALVNCCESLQSRRQLPAIEAAVAGEDALLALESTVNC